MLNKHQTGVGLLEVLMALLLLAIAVLGYSAMQMRAIKATDETLLRSDAMVVIRNISEDMRLFSNVKDTANANKKKYIDAIKAGTTTVAKDCSKAECNTDEQIQYTAANAMKLASDSGLSVGADWCETHDAGVKKGATDLKKVCLIVSWNQTKAESSADNKACLDANGIYKKGATCIAMETY